MITRRSALAAGLLAPFVGAGAMAAATPPTIEELMRPANTRGAALSPDGQRIALVHETHEGGRNAFVSLIQVSDFGARPQRVLIGDYDVEDVAWANSTRLLIKVLMKREESYTETGTRMGQVYNTSVRRILSLGLDGSTPVLLFSAHAFQRSNYNLGMVVDPLPEEPDLLLMQAWEPGGNGLALYRVNVVTGAAEFVERGSISTDTWSIQKGQAVLRWDFNQRGTSGVLFGRAPGETQWKPVRKITRESGFNRPDFDIVGSTEQAGVFLAVHRKGDEPSASLRPFDVRTMEFGQPIFARPDRDVDDALVDESGRFVAAVYHDDRVVYDFADKRLAPHFRGLESFYEKSCNVRPFSFSDDRNRFVARVSGPRQPGAYVYYDVAARQLEPIAMRQPWLTEDRLATVEPLEVRTRDNATLRAT